MSIGNAGIRPAEVCQYCQLDESAGKLRDVLQVESEAAREAHKFLKQEPVTEHKKSRLTATGTRTVTLENEG